MKVTKYLINIDAVEYLRYTADKPTMIFMDPPDNIGLKYGGYDDNLPWSKYGFLLSRCVGISLQIASVVWVSFNSRYTAHMGHIASNLSELEDNDWSLLCCVQTFTFGQHNHNDLGNCHRPLWRFRRKDAPLYPDAIRVESWRQAHGDKRADPRGRVPGDVFDFPRVTGNSKQRRAWSPTQLHEGLYERCIRLCCKPGDHVVDLFAGSGTLGRVAQRCQVHATMVELSRECCDHILSDQPTVEELGW